MTEIKINFEVSKQETVTPPPTHQKAANIKERLNLHVKRRLQQDSVFQTPEDSLQGHNLNRGNKNEIISMENKSEKTKRTSRKPYQKRIVKPENDNSVRKYKRTKQKQFGTIATGNEATSDDINSVHLKTSTLTLTGSSGGNGDDDGSYDGGNEAEGKFVSSKERDKCPDVLAMVLSVKKQALMRNSEVQNFLNNVMNAIKN